MGNQESGHDLHYKAEDAREAGKFSEALQLSDQSLVAYGEERNWHGFTEILVSRANTFKHLARKTNNPYYLTLAINELKGALEIAEEVGEKEDLALLYVGLGRTLEATERVQETVDAFKKGVEYMITNPPKDHNRPGVLADFQAHLAAAEYRAGDKSALERLNQAITDLETSGEDKISDYNYKVWLTGAHMRAADVLREEDPKSAKEHLAKTKEILDTDPEKLALRLEQYQELTNKFN